MADQKESLRAEILRSNDAARQWAAGLREQGRRARAAARETRRRAADSHLCAPRPVSSPEARDHSPEIDPVVLPSLGEVGVGELRALLITRHGFSPVEAARAVADGMAVCGYPGDHDSVVAADAFEVVERAVRPR